MGLGSRYRRAFGNNTNNETEKIIIDVLKIEQHAAF